MKNTKTQSVVERLNASKNGHAALLRQRQEELGYGDLSDDEVAYLRTYGTVVPVSDVDWSRFGIYDEGKYPTSGYVAVDDAGDVPLSEARATRDEAELDLDALTMQSAS